jgi:hypothetical protein
VLPRLFLKSPPDLFENRRNISAEFRRSGIKLVRVAKAFRDSLKSEVGIHPVVKKIDEEGII